MSVRADGQTTESQTGAVRSSDADNLEFLSLPWVGILAVARTSHEGATKYDRHNYRKGFRPSALFGHAMRHLVMWALGDRSEPHLAHAAWNVLVLIEALALDPSLGEEELLGPGATITPVMAAYMERNKAEKRRLRESGAFADLSDWRVEDLDEVRTLVSQRAFEQGEP